MIYVAIGANLPGSDGASPRQICERAITALRAIPGLRSLVRSRWYATAPIPVSDQPSYINGVARVQGALEPAALLHALQHIEAASGRVRGERNAARTLDLDIIDMHGMQRAAPDPVLPHPRAAGRAFVLLPLRDVAPGWVHPVSGIGIDALIALLPAQEARPV